MSAAALLWAWAAGWLWVRASRTASGLAPRWAALLTESTLAVPFGLGSTASLFFAFLWAGIAPRRAAFLSDGLVLAVGAVLFFLTRRHRPAAPVVEQTPPFRHAYLAVLSCAVCALAFAGAMYAYVNANPQGNWDAWSVWNVRAKFLSDPLEWRNAVSMHLPAIRPESPLLWPSAIARAWVETGDQSQSAPMAAALLSSYALVALFISALAALRGSLLASIGASILLTAVPLWRQAPGQYADTPLALLILASTAAALFSSRRDWHSGSMLLSGALASFAAFTRDEGLAFCVLLGAVIVSSARGRTMFWMLGAAPGLALAAAFKLLLAPHTPFFLLSNVTSARLWAVAGSLGSQLWSLGAFPAHPILLLALAIFLLGWRRPPVPFWPFVPAVGVLAAGLAMLWGAPQDPWAELGNSIDRLLVQVVPAILFSTMLGVQRPATPAPSAAPQRKRKS